MSPRKSPPPPSSHLIEASAAPPPPSWRADVIAVVLMLLATAFVYVPSGITEPGQMLSGSDYARLHMRRIEFAQSALFGPGHALPAWYPRELMGTPFWSNVQNFPFIPTRWPLLFVDPAAGYLVGVMIAATLAALFTWLYCRAIGLGPLPAAAAGWTFACSGFFASRVLPGHLPLLEAFPALPLLLWLVERYVRAENPRRRAITLGALALAVACTALAGHPQLPAYALSTAGFYALWRGGNWRGRFRLVAAMALGAGLAAFALVPMAMLVARSTRILALAPAYNDVPYPVWRLPSLIYPWANGSPRTFEQAPGHAFPASDAYFWDTIAYAGIFPVLAVLVLAIRQAVRRSRPSPALLFVAGVAVMALVLALPPVRRVTSLIPGTFLRSPARQLYITTFGLAVATGVASALLMAWLARFRRGTLLSAGMAVILTVHAIDVGWHARIFILSIDVPKAEPEERTLVAGVGDARVAYDYHLYSSMNRKADDVGFFDSVMLARPYRAMLSLARRPPDTNAQEFAGAALPKPALAFLGVRHVVTDLARRDLPTSIVLPRYTVYEVPGPMPRATYHPHAAAEFLDPEEVHARLRQLERLPTTIMLPPDATSVHPATTGSAAATPTYRRPSHDTIEVTIDAPAAGWIKVLETADPGWSATLDGHATPVVIADDLFLAIPVPAGRHAISLRYRTPGASAGLAISMASLFLLLGFCYYTARQRT